MPRVDIFEHKDDAPIFVGEFDFLPRVGDTVSQDAGGYFRYFDVKEVWHREGPQAGVFHACILVKLDD